MFYFRAIVYKKASDHQKERVSARNQDRTAAAALLKVLFRHMFLHRRRSVRLVIIDECALDGDNVSV